MIGLKFPITKENGGFTIIELLVGLTIIGIMAGAGVANYRKLEERKAVEAAAKQVELAIRDTQKRASAGVKPEGFCVDFDEFLEKYSIELAEPPLTARDYKITVYCSDGTSESETYSLSQEVMIEEAVSFDFDLLGQSSDENTVCVTNDDGTILFEVDVTLGGAVGFHFSTGSCSTTP